jgi:hypothetical protein
VLDPLSVYVYFVDMRKRSSKGKKLDLNELANDIVEEATDQKPEEPETKPENEGKNPAAVALGRLGGLKGGKARARKLTKKQRSEAARKAAAARWERHKKDSSTEDS